MKSKTLNTIQILMKVGKIISQIAFIFGIIGLVSCAVGIISLAFLPESFVIDGVKFVIRSSENENTSIGTMYSAMTVSLIMFIGETIIARFDYLFFKRELEVGTPFNFEVAKKMKYISIKMIVIPIICSIISTIAYEIFKATMSDVGTVHIGDEISFGVGIMLLIFSFVCKYGAEIEQERQEAEEELEIEIKKEKELEKELKKV